MSEEKWKRPLTDEQAEKIREEISSRVMERYAETKGVETREDELSATLAALRDITNLPMSEIEQIAKEVQEKHLPQTTASNPKMADRLTSPDRSLMAFEKLDVRAEAHKKGFIFHLIPYVVFSSMFVYLNVLSPTSFPWAMFPILGWGVGLLSHFMGAVHFPNRELRRKIETTRDQIGQVLQENWPGFFADRRESDFNGIYRLTVTRSSKELIQEYILSCEPTLSPETVSRITTQLVAIQNEMTIVEEEQEKHRDPFNRLPDSMPMPPQPPHFHWGKSRRKHRKR